MTETDNGHIESEVTGFKISHDSISGSLYVYYPETGEISRSEEQVVGTLGRERSRTIDYTSDGKMWGVEFLLVDINEIELHGLPHEDQIRDGLHGLEGIRVAPKHSPEEKVVVEII